MIRQTYLAFEWCFPSALYGPHWGHCLWRGDLVQDTWGVFPDLWSKVAQLLLLLFSLFMLQPRFHFNQAQSQVISKCLTLWFLFSNGYIAVHLLPSPRAGAKGGCFAHSPSIPSRGEQCPPAMSLTQSSLPVSVLCRRGARCHGSSRCPSLYSKAAPCENSGAQ